MSVPLPPQLPREPADTLEPRAYDAFLADFGATVEAVQFQGHDVHVNTLAHPANVSRGHTYWHMVTEGTPEENRVSPVRERLVKIPWARPVLHHSFDPGIKIWFSPRYANGHYCIWHCQANYLVVIKQLANGWLLKTAYTPDYKRVPQLHQEFAEAKRRK